MHLLPGTYAAFKEEKKMRPECATSACYITFFYNKQMIIV